MNTLQNSIPSLMGLLLLGLACAACSNDADSAATTEARHQDTPIINISGGGSRAIIPMVHDTGTPRDSGAPEDTDMAADALIDEPFDRDALARDTAAADDTTVASDDVSLPGETLSGQNGCYGWTLETQSTIFTLKVDNVFVAYEVRNTCPSPIRVRTEHQSDMFPVGIQKNGEPWIFLPDCLGTGAREERIFNTGDGWRRGWLWTTDDHEARLMRCGVSFEAGAEYTIVGYGLTEVPFSGTTELSALYPLTEPIPITLQLAEE